MTRENKLALVIGFGLLLLAGILVSDHLSAQQRVDEDSLVATEARVVPNPSILQPKNAPAAAIPRQTTAAPQAARTEPQASKRREIVIGTPPGARERATKSPSRVTQTMRFHNVKAGETLSEISELYFGTRSRWQEIARANNIPNANGLRVGTRLVIPSGPSATASDAPSAQPRVEEVVVAVRTTTVREGDTLSGIAKRELGTGTRWKELWKANLATLPDPDLLAPGMTLRLPASSVH